MGYNKESERQSEVLKDLIAGKEHIKKYVQVGYEGTPEENLNGKTRTSKIFDIMATARMPWFCPSCKKTMKKKLDNKFWRIAGHCFDCHVEMENKLRMNGKYEQYAKKKINENKKSYLKDLKNVVPLYETYYNKSPKKVLLPYFHHSRSK